MSPRQVEYLAKSGRIPAPERHGNRVRWPRAALLAFLADLSSQANGQRQAEPPAAGPRGEGVTGPFSGFPSLYPTGNS